MNFLKRLAQAISIEVRIFQNTRNYRRQKKDWDRYNAECYRLYQDEIALYMKNNWSWNTDATE